MRTDKVKVLVGMEFTKYKNKDFSITGTDILFINIKKFSIVVTNTEYYSTNSTTTIINNYYS